MGRSRTGLLIVDANVLIDFCEADRTVLRLISRHVGKVHVPLPVLREEVEQLDDSECAELGIILVEPSLELVAVVATRRAGLSFYDHLCLLLALENGWTCVTNDTCLRRECEAENIPVLWGLEMVALLVDRGILTPKAAEEIALAIRRANPRYITEKVLAKFLVRIRRASREAARRRTSKKVK